MSEKPTDPVDPAASTNSTTSKSSSKTVEPGSPSQGESAQPTAPLSKTAASKAALLEAPVRGAGTAETRQEDSADVLLQAYKNEADPRGRWNFETVWRLEQATIRARRMRIQDSAATSATGEDASIPPASAAAPDAQSASATPRRAGGNPKAAINEGLESTTALSLSGGGIRSASFNLGVLQAFAEQRLIGNLDYLSTVSGGGYIGSWLTCWICRDGDVRNVEKLLVPERTENATAHRQFVESNRVSVNEFITPRIDTGEIHEKEPEPVVHLRANSNYLALRPGIMTPDSWALIAIYLRNILLNSLVVIPTLLAVILMTMWLTLWYNIERYPHTFRAFLAGLVLIFLAVQGVFKSLNGVRASVQEADNHVSEVPYWDTYFGWLVVATVASAYSISLDLVSPGSWFLWFCTWGGSTVGFTWTNAWRFALTLGLCHMALNYSSIWALLKGAKANQLILWPISGFTSGYVLGLLIYGVACFLQTCTFPDIAGIHPSGVPQGAPVLQRHAYQALLAVPLLLSSFFVSEVVQIGILGRLELPEVREKWSAFQARCFMGGLIWFALVLHVFFIANFLPIVAHFTGQSSITSTLATVVAGGMWLISAVGSLTLAQSSSSAGQAVSGNNRKWRDILILAGPAIFLSGILSGTSAILLAYMNPVTHNLEVGIHVSPWLASIAMLLLGIALGRFVDINIFSLQELYAARLIRCFLGASRRDDRPPRGAPFRTYASLRRPDAITSMAPQDDLTLASLRTSTAKIAKTYNGPLHLINTAVNLTRDIDLQRQERKADSFVFSPIACGNPQLMFRPTASLGKEPGYAGGVHLGTAVALSGAAVSPNMGYYSSPAVTALLTVFNVRLGAWMSNPLSLKWTQPGPRMGWLHLVKEMMGLTDATSEYVYISDGGHFDNLGVYELLRRRVTTIFASDAGADPRGHCNELGMVIRKAYVDFGIDIRIDISELKIDPTSLASKAYFAIGTIHYPALTLPGGQLLPAKTGTLFYIKMTRTGTEPTDVETYHGAHPDFPQQSTIHQFYSESQFESYRHLGHHIGSMLLTGQSEEYRGGHARAKPKTTRTSQQLKRFIAYVKAINAIRAPQNWDETGSKYDEQYAQLVARLVTQPALQKMRNEVDKVTEILEECDTLYHQFGKGEPTNNATREQLRQDLKALQQLPRDKPESSAEIAWMIEAFTLLSNVMVRLQWDNYETTLRTEWIRVMRQWMCTSTFKNLWGSLKNSYPASRDDFVTKLLKDDDWVNV